MNLIFRFSRENLPLPSYTPSVYLLRSCMGYCVDFVYLGDRAFSYIIYYTDAMQCMRTQKFSMTMVRICIRRDIFERTEDFSTSKLSFYYIVYT